MFNRNFAIALGATLPVLVLVGCPVPGAGTGASPTPTAAATATASATPARTGLLVKEISLHANGTDVASRSITVVNKTGAAITDLGNYIVSYEYNDSGTNKMQHKRFGKGAALAADAEFKFYDRSCTGTNTDCVTTEAALGGTSASTLGLQVTNGSLVIYKTDATAANQHDYVQYGAAPTNAFTHAADAVTRNNWDDAAKYGPAITPTAGSKISAKTLGNSGSTNWQ